MLRRLKPWAINPLNLSDPINTEALGLFFDQHAGQPLYLSTTTHKTMLIDPNSQATESYAARLTEDAYRRVSAGNKNQGRIQYEIVRASSANSDAIQEQGAVGSIIDIAGTLSFDAAGLAILKNKGRLFKVLSYQTSKALAKLHAELVNPLAFLTKLANHEYQMTPAYLGMKPPMVVDDKVLMCMTRIPGKTLETHCFGEDTSIHQLTLGELTNLSLAVLCAVRSDIQSQRRVHRDLKPANIVGFFDPITRKWVFSVIDFGNAKKITDSDIGDSNTCAMAYSSPEAYYDQGTTEKSDVYSCGCILSELFGFRDNHNLDKEDILEEFRSGELILDDPLDDRNIDENDPLKQTIIDLIQRMTQKDPLERMSLNAAIDELESICNRANCLDALCDFIEDYIDVYKKTPFSFFLPGGEYNPAITKLTDKIIKLVEKNKTIAFDHDELKLLASQPQLTGILENYTDIKCLADLLTQTQTQAADPQKSRYTAS